MRNESNGLSGLMLQSAMIAEMKKLFSDIYLKNVDGVLVLPNIYAQHIPVKIKQKDLAHFPYITVVLRNADDINSPDPLKATLFFAVGVWDDSDDYQGWVDAANAIDRIYNHLMDKQKFGNFTIDYPVNRNYVEIGEGGEVKDYFPFFYTGIETNWEIGKVTKTSKFL